MTLWKSVLPRSNLNWKLSDVDMLDTNIAIYVIKRRPPEALATFNQHAGQLHLVGCHLITQLIKQVVETENSVVLPGLCNFRVSEHQKIRHSECRGFPICRRKH